jgi:hypothetical protein
MRILMAISQKRNLTNEETKAGLGGGGAAR